MNCQQDTDMGRVVRVQHKNKENSVYYWLYASASKQETKVISNSNTLMVGLKQRFSVDLCAWFIKKCVSYVSRR